MVGPAAATGLKIEYRDGVTANHWFSETAAIREYFELREYFDSGVSNVTGVKRVTLILGGYPWHGFSLV